MFVNYLGSHEEEQLRASEAAEARREVQYSAPCSTLARALHRAEQPLTRRVKHCYSLPRTSLGAGRLCPLKSK